MRNSLSPYFPQYLALLLRTIVKITTGYNELQTNATIPIYRLNTGVRTDGICFTAAAMWVLFVQSKNTNRM